MTVIEFREYLRLSGFGDDVVQVICQYINPILFDLLDDKEHLMAVVNSMIDYANTEMAVGVEEHRRIIGEKSLEDRQVEALEKIAASLCNRGGVGVIGC